MRFLIIGGDAAGMSAASRAKRLDPSVSVTVLEQTQDVSYSACNMPYNIADPSRSIEDLVVRPARVFREKMGIDLKTGYRAEQIDIKNQAITGQAQDSGDFRLDYDRLLIATGASPIMPDLPGFELPGVMALKSLSDGRAVKSYLKNHDVKKVVIVGMGYIALEMCEALRARNIDVEMVKPRPGLLPWLARDLADPVRQTLENHQVRLHMGKKVDGIEQADHRLNVMGASLSIRADMVLVAIGVRPNSELAAGAGLGLGPADAIAVDGHMGTSVANIYAAGDCADAFHVVSGQRTWIPLALRANRAGWAVADHLSGKPVELPGVAGTAVFKVFDMQVARTGLTASESDAAGFQPESVTISTSSRAHLYHPRGSKVQVHMVGDRSSGRLLGVQMVGRESVAHRINAAAVALHASMTVAQFVQCDLAYAPPFGGVWDPLLIAANQLIKKL
ncbi:MAG: FAD-dependent oxidoreductase [Desulfobacteraceae bacterium]|jgi:NADPH-dependent 2,4-dienoyl-CoA reductase/sulfur reductase-like enzyme